MSTILLPTDFSDEFRRAEMFAIKLFGHNGNKFVLSHAYQLPRSTGMLISIEDIMRKDAEDYLVKEVNFMKEQGISGDKLLSITQGGDITEVLNEVIQNYGIDMVVMGTKEKKGLERLLIGSSAAKMIMESKIPVLIVPTDVENIQLERIVLAIEYNGEEDLSVLKPLIEMAEFLRVQLVILNVFQGPEKLHDAVHAAVKSEFENLFRNVSHIYDFIKGDDTVKEIENYVSGLNADMLVVISRRKTLIEKLFKKSVSKELTFRTKIPLLVMR